MDVVEVDDVGIEPLQASLAAHRDLVRPSVRCRRASAARRGSRGCGREGGGAARGVAYRASAVPGLTGRGGTPRHLPFVLAALRPEGTIAQH
jgi:hypothetical protein